MYKHILVTVAFDADHEPEQSLQAAKALVGKDGRVTVFHVKDAVPSYAISYMPAGYDEDLKVALNDKLKALADRFENASGVLVEGHAARTILDWSEANAVDCIIIASHRPDVLDYFLGSTAARVVRHAKCSVHVIR